MCRRRFTVPDDRTAPELWDELSAKFNHDKRSMGSFALLGYLPVLAALEEIEVHCPCGARPESLNTHPHVVLCPVGDALACERERLLEALR
jgi:hypothetical protein